MAGAVSRGENAIHIRRTFSAPRPEVYRAWTEAEKLSRWLGRPNPQYACRVLEQDLRVGGKYRIEVTSPEGQLYLLYGTYKEVRPEEKLVFTWAWETDPGFGETLVTVEFRDLGSSTEVALTHEFFASKEALEGHSAGWNGCFASLESLLAG
jgi:uncharacterized protein YndB with AHSA1/START domain